LALVGGILGRTDDMVIVRGVNVYPSAVEEIIRACGGVAEFQAQVSSAGPLAELQITIEPQPNFVNASALAQKIEEALLAALSLRVPVTIASAGSLPRFELKAKRWVRV
jgi:phenylacetate-CoA ligase